jgi:hypothetical protein
VVVAFNAAVGLLSQVGSFYRHSVIAAFIVAIVIQAGALWWRRSHSVAVMLVITVVQIGMLVVSPDHEPGGPALAFAVYSVSVYDRSRVRIVVAANSSLVAFTSP